MTEPQHHPWCCQEHGCVLGCPAEPVMVGGRDWRRDFEASMRRGEEMVAEHVRRELACRCTCPTGEHHLDDGRCLCCHLDLEYTVEAGA